jgi:hypothetical protein
MRSDTCWIAVFDRSEPQSSRRSERNTYTFQHAEVINIATVVW